MHCLLSDAGEGAQCIDEEIHEMTPLPDQVTSEQEVKGAWSPLTKEKQDKATYEGDKEKPKIVVMAYKLCGIPLKTTVNITEHRETIYKVHFLKERSFWKNFLDFNAIIGCMIIVFLIGYFH